MHGIRILRHIKGNLETGLRRSLNKTTHPPTRHQTFSKVWPPAGPPNAVALRRKDASGGSPRARGEAPLTPIIASQNTPSLKATVLQGRRRQRLI